MDGWLERGERVRREGGREGEGVFGAREVGGLGKIGYYLVVLFVVERQVREVL